MYKRPNATDELVDIYTLLRLVDSSADPEDNRSGKPIRLESIFPRQFINKVLNEHILHVKDLSNEICNQIFNLPGRDERIDKQPGHLARVDEYFHFCLHQLYDYVTNLDWYDNGLYTIKDLDDPRYKDFKEFLNFRDRLDDITTLVRGRQQKHQSSVSPSESKFNKSNLRSSGSASSPRDRRRVRFSKAVLVLADDKEPALTQRYRKEVQMLFALDLQIYGINLFFQQLCSNLWSAVETNAIPDNLRKITDSKSRIETTHLRSVTKDIRAINRIFLMSLDCLNILKEVYLLGHLSEMVSFEYPRILRYQLDRIKSYSRWVGEEMEGKIILKLVKHFLQVIFTLITFEINLPPLDLNAKTSTKSRADLGRSRENQSNFILSWLGVDDRAYNMAQTNRKVTTSKASTLADGLEYRSLSQITDQMENLHRMLADLAGNLIKQMFSDRQRKYLLNLTQFGFSKYYAEVSLILSTQLAKSRELMRGQSEDEMTGSIDSIAAKIRCLKFIYIMANLEKLIQDLSHLYKIELFDTDLQERISAFIDNIDLKGPIGKNTAKSSLQKNLYYTSISKQM